MGLWRGGALEELGPGGWGSRIIGPWRGGALEERGPGGVGL